MTDLATDLARAYDAARQLADAMRRGHCATTAGHLDQAARCLASACGQARIATRADYDRDSRRTIPALIVDLERIGEQLPGGPIRHTLGMAHGYARDAQRSLNRGGVLVDVGRI